MKVRPAAAHNLSNVETLVHMSENDPCDKVRTAAYSTAIEHSTSFPPHHPSTVIQSERKTLRTERKYCERKHFGGTMTVVAQQNIHAGRQCVPPCTRCCQSGHCAKYTQNILTPKPCTFDGAAVTWVSCGRLYTFTDAHRAEITLTRCSKKPYSSTSHPVGERRLSVQSPRRADADRPCDRGVMKMFFQKRRGREYLLTLTG